ncbi:anti-phage-associated DUF1156 domain-containing protein [Siccirubricoccus phaeus]|uniref:anti-phage-associated DUF1156 domain-containing protein n=1 Tax=Siccirubricoccus phaeus TaxID=2595053 RepID=UPI0011F3B389|nr:anti-phage-associated DUF1156 domain-containing protein [Siccirubricoccus phaeus]
MDTVVELARPAARGLEPFSLRDAPALIERAFPAQKVGIEAQKERKANTGQTLTILGAYWKGRKPLVLVRACVLAALLPATDDPDGDLEVFEALMGMDDGGMLRRQPTIGADLVWGSTAVSAAEKAEYIEVTHLPGGRESKAKWRRIALEHITKAEDRRAERERIQAIRESLKERAFLALPFAEQVSLCGRAEEVENLSDLQDPLRLGVWARVNAHLGTNASSLPDLIRQLGIARYGHAPKVGDPFAGGGSIPFEAARIGCEANASDLNPIAAMLNWGSLNIIGASEEARRRIAAEQERVLAVVEEEILRLGIEQSDDGHRAKAYLYCLEAVDPQTGWLVPLAPSWVVSQDKRCIARLVPDRRRKRFDIQIVEGASHAEILAARRGTLVDGSVVYTLAIREGGEEVEWRIPFARLRGDGEGPQQADGSTGNLLRRWEKPDVAPRPHQWVADAEPVMAGSGPGAWIGGDILQERLYCVQWMDGEDVRQGKARPRLFFAAPTTNDIARDCRIEAIVKENLAVWQERGLVPDMTIEAGDKTSEPIRTRGWTHWHHLFTPRHLLMLAKTMEASLGSEEEAALRVALARVLDRSAKLCQWSSTPAQDLPLRVFVNQALNTLASWGGRAFHGYKIAYVLDLERATPIAGKGNIRVGGASTNRTPSDLWIYDPPYADAVNYHEITEFFIAWLRKNPPGPFAAWTWDSRRPLAIQGKGDKFRADMVAAFKAMADHMPENGLQVCMFTHTDAGVWADMAQIVWGAGLQVTAAWYVSTETTSELKKGGYVQGTVLLVLRKRRGSEQAYRDEIVPAIRHRVEEQVRTLMGLNQRARGRQRDENLFSRADLQMAGYAAAMEVLTGCTHIDGVDMTREALRPRVRGERGLVEEMIDLAVQTATELMTPEGIEESLWERLTATERFYLTMTEAEADRPQGQPGGKLDDYQNFAKAYRADGWEDLMADKTPNKACLKGPAEFRRALMTGHAFSEGILRPTLYAINELRLATEREEDPRTAADRVLHGLRDHFGEWVRQRASVRAVAAWFGRMWARNRPAEASAARQLAGIIQSERL